MRVGATLQVNGQTMTGTAEFKEGDAFVRFTSDNGTFTAMFRKELCNIGIEHGKEESPEDVRDLWPTVPGVSQRDT